MMSINLRVRDTSERIEGRVLDALRTHLNSVFRHAASAIKHRLGVVCDSLIQRTDEYRSLLGGELLGELGVPEIEHRLGVILKTIKNSVEVSATPIVKTGRGLSGGMVFKMLRSDFLDVLGLPEATYLTEKGTPIPWLDWLLTQGVKIIVIGYDVDFNLTPAEKIRSRTGLALMERGTGWRVPPEFSGTLENNFLTRAFNGTEVERMVASVVAQEIQARI